MAVKVLIPTMLRGFVENRSEIDLSGATVSEVLHSLAAAYPEAGKALFLPGGELRSFALSPSLRSK